ncbi:MAG: D-alanine--D-alanine ligase family protein [Myxococcota bacterium]|nr:D-alanine--D-alanine ligase family protein [Myxococcota bacterium]
MGKIRVGLLFGGRSVEHEVSLRSATSIFHALDAERYDVTLIAIDHEGRWRLGAGPELLPEKALHGEEVNLAAVPGSALTPVDPQAAATSARSLDVVFPIIHGRGGEDGQLQGLLELAELPYVGSGVLSSAVQMDKDVARRLLAASGLPVVPDFVLRTVDPSTLEGRASAAEAAVDRLGLPLFVKPANSGSSIGISKAGDLASLLESIDKAARFDTKVVIEKAIDAREIEVAVLGNTRPEASVPGEILPNQEFYDYEAKYLNESTELLVPAPLPEDVGERVRSLALKAFQALEGEGIARVDFFLEKETGEICINELNSLPGFTEGSMFPRLWAASGLPYPALLERMIDLAIERHSRRSKLVTRYSS